MSRNAGISESGESGVDGLARVLSGQDIWCAGVTAAVNVTVVAGGYRDGPPEAIQACGGGPTPTYGALLLCGHGIVNASASHQRIAPLNKKFGSAVSNLLKATRLPDRNRRRSTWPLTP